MNHRSARKTALPVILIGMLPVPVALAAHPEGWFTDSGGNRPFAQPLAMDDAARERFDLGRSFFSTPWVEAPSATTARDGLGPHFNANTCASCHAENGGARTVSAEGRPLRPLLFKLAQPSRQSERRAIENAEAPFHDRVPDPVYGVQIAINGNAKVMPEAEMRLAIETVPFRYPDGATRMLTRLHPRLERLAYGPLAPETAISMRQPPALAGLGLIEAVPDGEILAWQDPEDRDRDGISGRANRVAAPDADRSVLGRFNWKASEATLRGQVANAAAHDMGLTNPLYPAELCSSAQRDCLAAPRGRTTPQGSLDLPDLRLRAIAAYVAGFRAPQPAALDARALQGKRLFETIGCASCHRATLTTQAGVAFHPFSDLLLHDMGEDLRDDLPEFLATEREYRTAPLWGLGGRLRAGERFLHDARAVAPEDAVLWHGGEAEAAKTRFVRLDRDARAALLHFLEQL